MTDEMIIKALECCVTDGYTCNKCPYEDTKHIINEEYELMPNGKHYDEWSCDEWLKKDLLDLINRQKAEIERYSEPTSESAKWMLAQKVDRAVDEMSKFINQIKAEAIKEFAERLKEEVQWEESWDGEDECVYTEIDYWAIDTIAEEIIRGLE